MIYLADCLSHLRNSNKCLLMAMLPINGCWGLLGFDPTLIELDHHLEISLRVKRSTLMHWSGNRARTELKVMIQFLLSLCFGMGNGECM